MTNTQFKSLTMYLQGKSVKAIAKALSISENYVYVIIGKEVITLNTMLNLSLGLKCGDILRNPQPYVDAIKQITGVQPRLGLRATKSTATPKTETRQPQKARTIQFDNVDQLFGILKDEALAGAILMYNYLNERYESK